MNTTFMKYLCVLLMATSIQATTKDIKYPTNKPIDLTEKFIQFPQGGSLQEAVFHILQTLLIPIGFTYVQLPKEKSPREIWPMITWKEVSFEYAGYFFRVEGGRSKDFGEVQEASSPKIHMVHSSRAKSWSTGGMVDGQMPLNQYGWSELIYTGDSTKNFTDHIGLKFSYAQDEPRPINMAMRIWRRVQ